MLFLRITPLVPNWFVNIASPIAGISFPIFFSGTLLGIVWKYGSLTYIKGLMPANIIHVRAGLVLNDLEKVGMNLQVNIYNF